MTISAVAKDGAKSLRAANAGLNKGIGASHCEPPMSHQVCSSHDAPDLLCVNVIRFLHWSPVQLAMGAQHYD